MSPEGQFLMSPDTIGVPGTLLDAFEQLKAEMGQTWPSAD